MIDFNDLEYLDWEEQEVAGIDAGDGWMNTIAGALCGKKFRGVVKFKHVFYCCNFLGHKGHCAWKLVDGVSEYGWPIRP